MEVYVLEYSTDDDIKKTTLSASWNVQKRHSYTDVAANNCNLPNGCVILIIAHGNNSEIGNASSGVVDYDPKKLLTSIKSNMAPSAAPKKIYLSVCQDARSGIAAFAAKLSGEITSVKEHAFKGAVIAGHNKGISGSVPPPKGVEWFEIYP